MATFIREMLPEDSRAFLEVHHAAVRGIAARDYSPDVIEAWAPMPITDTAVAWVQANPEREYRLVAEVEKRVVGIAALVIPNAELHACYVAPEVTRKGIGSALVRDLERIARHWGLTFLELDSSLTASSFYQAKGYRVVEYGEHVLPRGQRMACLKMRKYLVSPAA